MKSFFRIILTMFFSLTIFIGCATTEETQKDAVVYYNQGNAYEKNGEYDKAISAYNKAININPKYALAYNNRGLAYNYKGRYNKSISDFNKAIELNPGLDKPYNNRGMAYGKKGQYDKAISDYNKAIEINPRYDVAYNNRGLAYYFKGQYDKAIFDFTKAIEINSSYADPHNNKAWILATCRDDRYRDGAKAVELAKKALELDPKGNWLDTLAAAYAEAGNFEDAITTQENVINFMKKEGMPKNQIDQSKEHLKSYKNNKPWREK
jgi:tetratricopeptide (TPR) repeat protein